MGRARFTQLAANRCILTYEDAGGNTVQSEYWAPVAGGYVDNDGRSVCEYLSSTGRTLCWHNKNGPLVVEIRREWRRRKARERRRRAKL